MPANINSLTVLDMVPFGYGGQDVKFFALRLSPPNWPDWKPGQFVMLRPESWGADLPWGRPFSICRLTSQDLVLFFQVAGRGTARLASVRAGENMQVTGPLGTGFIMEAETPTLMLAGGIGIAPFVGYTMCHPTPWTLHLDFGHRLPLDCYPFENFNDKILAEHYFERNQRDLQTFIQVMDEHIAEYAGKGGLVLACGPTPFLRTAQRLGQKHKARVQLSVENRMACGVGACLGCVVKPLVDAEGKNLSAQKIDPALETGLPVSSCTCGPVFWADSIDLGE